MTNEKLGQLFNMSYSAISHCVKIFKEKMNKDKKVKSQFEEINSQFKLLTPIFLDAYLTFEKNLYSGLGDYANSLY